MLLVRFLKDAMYFDQYDVTNGRAYEKMFGELQTIEYTLFTEERSKEATAAKSDTDVLLMGEKETLLGSFKENGEYMICTALIDHLGGELAEDFTRQKGASKLRDLQIARAKAK